MNKDKSLVPAYILEILRNHSSEEHPLRHKEIGAMLESEYGINMDRTAVSRNVNTLADAGLIEKNGKGRQGARRLRTQAAHSQRDMQQRDSITPGKGSDRASLRRRRKNDRRKNERAGSALLYRSGRTLS